MYKHILIPTDGSDLSMQGVRHGLALAKSESSKVTTIYVNQPYPLQSAVVVDHWNSSQREMAEKALRAVSDAARQAGVEVAVHGATDESPAEAIVSAAKELGCDLIVMASHGRRGMSRLLLGSQTAEVVAHSPVPVLVVR